MPQAVSTKLGFQLMDTSLNHFNNRNHLFAFSVPLLWTNKSSTDKAQALKGVTYLCGG